MVLHDETINRTTNGRGRVDRMSLSTIKMFNAGDGERIPTVGEVLEAARGRVGLMLELKVKGVAQETVKAVQRAGFNEPVIYASFLHDELMDVRSVDAAASLMVLFGRLPRAPVARAMKHRPSHVGLRHDTATHRLVDAFHRENLLVCVYTADSLGDIQRALSLGVDGVISNYPERIGNGRNA